MYMDYFICFMNFLYDLVVGSSDVNFAIAPLIGAGLIAGGASLLGSIFGHSSQKSANETNIQLAREQRQFDLDMWNRQNEYNTDSAQMQRAREAGINPYMAISNIAGGQSNTFAGGQSAPTVQPSPIGEYVNSASQNFMNAYTAFTQAEQMEIQNKNIQAATEAQDIENRYNAATLMDRIQGNRSMFRKNSMEAKLFGDIYKNLVKQSDESTSIMELQKGVLFNQMRISAIEAYISETFQVPMTQKNSQLLSQAISKGVYEIEGLQIENKLNNKRYDEIVQNITESVARVANINADTDLKRLRFAIDKALFPITLKNAEMDYTRNSFGFAQDRQNYSRGRIGLMNDSFNMMGTMFDSFRKGKQMFNTKVTLPMFGSFGVEF